MLRALPGQPAGSKWAQVWGDIDNTPPDDTAANAKVNCSGGHRGGPVATYFGKMGPQGTTSGLIPGYPFQVFYINNVGASADDKCYAIGNMPDVRGVNIRNLHRAKPSPSGRTHGTYSGVAKDRIRGH